MISLTLPKLSMTMEEATVVAWLVEDGTELQEGQAYVEIETDKAQQELVAPAAGVLRIVAGVGSQVLLDGVLGELHDGADAAIPAPSAPPPSAERRAAASPAARSIAAGLGIDIDTVVGSGPGGRIGVADVQAAADAAGSSAPAPAAPAPVAPERGTNVGLRGAVVANIVASWQQVPHIHISGELVADGLAEARSRLLARGTSGVSATDLLILALALALAEVPELNGTVGSDGTPTRAEAIDVSLAVATSGGVVAPIVRDVASRSLAEIAGERARLVEAARAGTLSRRDLGGGSFTLSNLGAYPVDFFAPVVTGPQIATLATGRAARRPVAIGDAIGLGTRLTANVAIDHRGADGQAGARFLAAFERHLATLPDHV